MDPSIPPTLGRRVADCRERLGWTQKTLADKAALSITFVSEIENDRRAPGTEALRRLADALGASLDYLVKGVSDPAPPRRPLVLPAELAEAAEQGRWSVGVASDLLRFRQMVIARRSRGGAVGEGERDLSPEEWRQLYEVYHRLFGSGDGATHT